MRPYGEASSWTAREPRSRGDRVKRRIEEIIAQHTGQTARNGLQRHGARLLHDLRASDSLRHHRPGHPEPHRDGVAAVASVSAGACQPEGARHGGKEAAEVACADRGEGASEAQAAEEDLARQVETRHACPAALRGGRVLGRKHLKKLQDAARGGGQGLIQVGTERRKNDPDGCAQARQRVAVPPKDDSVISEGAERRAAGEP